METESEITLFRMVDGKPIINYEAVRQADLDGRRDMEFFDENYHKFLEQYPNQWVAVFREQVVAVSPDMEDLFQQVEAQGVRRGAVMGGFMNPNPPERIVSVFS